MKKDNLLREESIVVDCLSKYESLKWPQLIKLLYNKQEDVAQRILVGLKKRQIVIEDEAGYLMLDPRSKEDYKTTTAFWVLLQFIDKIKPEENYKANYPSNIYFLKQGQEYEIIVLYKNEEHLLKPLFMENRNSSNEDEDAVKYIIVVPDEDSIDDFIGNVPDSVLDKGNVLFSTVKYASTEDECPVVEFYQV